MCAQWRNPSYKELRTANNFSAGTNQGGNDPFDISPNASTVEYGWDFDLFPALAVRKGRTAYGSSGGGVTYLLTNYANNFLVRAVGTTLQYYNGTDWTTLATGFTATDWAAANFDVSGSALIITNGTDNVKLIKGTPTPTISDLSASAPKGPYIAANNLRVYIATNDIVNFSAFQNATDWTTPDNAGLIQYYTPRGGNITGLKGFEGNIWVFKKDSFAVIFLTGDSRSIHRLVEQSSSIGCVSSKTIVEVSGYLFWLGAQDIYMGAGGAARGIGNKQIRSIIQSINTTYWNKCFAWTDGYRYYLCLVTGSNTEPDTEIVFDTRSDRTGIWRVRSISLGGLRYGALLNTIPYAGDVNGQTYQLNNGTTDNGVAIPWSITSKPFDDGQKEAEKDLLEMHLQGYFPSTSTLNVSVSPDDRGSNFISVSPYPETVNTVATSNRMIVPLDTVPISFWYRYQISGSGYVEINEVQRYSRIIPVQI
jgi:hypothetical protein